MFMLLIQVSITVAVDSDGPLDLSGTDLTTSYCEAKYKECPGADLNEVFAADAHECHARCNRNLECLSAFYVDQICHLRAERCTSDQLVPSTGTTYYRLKKIETCPSGISPYVAFTTSFSNSFCMIANKACPGSNLYPKPLNLQPYQECLKKCAKITTCTGVDYNGKCSPKDRQCSDAELVDAPGTDNYMRLEEGVTKCSASRIPPPEPTTTQLPPTQPPPTQPPPTQPPPTQPPPTQAPPTQPPPTQAPVCRNNGPQEVALMVVGTRVKRGCDWSWGDQDGPAPSLGRISSPLNSWEWSVGPGWIGVKWDTGSMYRYRMGAEGKYDLELA